MISNFSARGAQAKSPRHHELVLNTRPTAFVVSARAPFACGIKYRDSYVWNDSPEK